MVKNSIRNISLTMRIVVMLKMKMQMKMKLYLKILNMRTQILEKIYLPQKYTKSLEKFK